MRRRTLSVVAVVLAIALVAAGTATTVLTPVQAQTAQSEAGSDTKTVTVSGDGTASTTPDKAVVEVAVVAQGEDPSAIREDLAAGADDLRSALNAAGVAPEQVTTAEYRIRQTPPHRRERREDASPYRGVHAFRVELTDTDRAGGVVEAAAESGAEVQTVRFTLTDETRETLRDQALQNAMGDARRQAETLGAAGDLQVTGVESIDATQRRYEPVRYEAAVPEASGAGGTSIEAGDVSVTATVRVQYNATG